MKYGKKYDSPEILVKLFSSQDVLTDSNPSVDDVRWAMEETEQWKF